MTPGAEHPATLATIDDFSVLGPGHPHTIELLNQLVHFYESWNKAERWRARLPQN